MPTAKRKCAKCGRLRTFGAFASARARVCKQCTRTRKRDYSHAQHVENTYGITSDEYAALLKAQGGACAGCGGTRRYRLHVDHDHALERAGILAGLPPAEAARRSVRGLLCAGCNKLLRDARDNPERLRKLARYLSKPPARRILAVGIFSIGGDA